jgi:hypothetical protein
VVSFGSPFPHVNKNAEMFYSREELWQLFSSDADDCEDKEGQATTYEDYVRRFIDQVPDRNELFELDKFFVRVKVPEDAAEEGIAEIFHQMELDAAPVNDYKAVLEVWLDKTRMHTLSRFFWRSCLHGLFRFYDIPLLNAFLKSEGFVYWWNPLAEPPALEPVQVMEEFEETETEASSSSSSPYSYCIIS